MDPNPNARPQSLTLIGSESKLTPAWKAAIQPHASSGFEASPERQELAAALATAEKALLCEREEREAQRREAEAELKGVEGVRDMLAGIIKAPPLSVRALEAPDPGPIWILIWIECWLQEKDAALEELQGSLGQAGELGVGSPLSAISELGELGEARPVCLGRHLNP